MSDYIPTTNYYQVVPNSNVPNTNWVRELYVSGIYARFGEHHELAKDPTQDFARWLEQHDNEVAIKTMNEYYRQHFQETVRTQNE